MNGLMLDLQWLRFVYCKFCPGMVFKARNVESIPVRSWNIVLPLVHDPRICLIERREMKGLMLALFLPSQKCPKMPGTSWKIYTSMFDRIGHILKKYYVIFEAKLRNFLNAPPPQVINIIFFIYSVTQRYESLCLAWHL